MQATKFTEVTSIHSSVDRDVRSSIRDYVEKQEFSIDIHIMRMKLKVAEKTAVRVFWSKEKNKIKTPLA
jgi:hypothetical protein